MMKRLLAALALLTLPAGASGALVGHWPLQDNAASTTVVATVGTDATLTNAGNTSASTSTPGPGTALPRCLTFDGTNDKVVATTGNAGIARNKSVVTVCCWFKATTGDTTVTHCLAFASVNGAGNTRAGLFINSNGQVICYARAPDGGSVQTKNTVSSYDDGNWHHASAVINYAADTTTIRIDGTTVAQDGTSSFTDTVTSDTDSTSVIFGGGVASDYFKGQLADVRYYDSDESANISAIIAEADASSPTITTSATQSLEESERDVVTVAATDGATPYVWSITGGADQALFAINSSTGALTMPGSADYENPEDADTNNVYVLEVTCTDDDSATDALTINVTVTDEGGAGTGFSAGVNNGPVR